MREPLVAYGFFKGLTPGQLHADLPHQSRIF